MAVTRRKMRRPAATLWTGGDDRTKFEGMRTKSFPLPRAARDRRFWLMVAMACLWMGLIGSGTQEGIAQEVPPHLLFGRDDRVQVDAARAPWRAIGRLEFDGGHCTGVLMSERVVLTSAHCFFRHPTANTSLRDRPIAFRAGYQNGSDVGRADIVTYWVPPGYEPIIHEQTLAEEGLDYGFVLLDRPLGRKAGAFGVHEVTPAELIRARAEQWRVISQAGYSGDQDFHLTAHEDCEITDFTAFGVIYHRCDIVKGDSGSPMFVVDESGIPQVIGIVSAYLDRRPPMNLAVDSRSFAHDLARFIARYDPQG